MKNRDNSGRNDVIVFFFKFISINYNNVILKIFTKNCKISPLNSDALCLFSLLLRLYVCLFLFLFFQFMF